MATKIFVNSFCTIGDGSAGNPWQSSDGSAGIDAAWIAACNDPSVVEFVWQPGYYKATKANITIDLGDLGVNRRTQQRFTFSGQGARLEISPTGWMTDFDGHGLIIQCLGQNRDATLVINHVFELPNVCGNASKALINFNNDHARPSDWRSYAPAFNSCRFYLYARNTHSGLSNPSGNTFIDMSDPATVPCGVGGFGLLESDVYVNSVVNYGYAFRVEQMNFSRFSGALSNWDASPRQLAPGVGSPAGIVVSAQPLPAATGLVLRNCQSNSFLAFDTEVCGTICRMYDVVQNNTFLSIIDINGTTDGAVFEFYGIDPQSNHSQNICFNRVCNLRMDLVRKTGADSWVDHSRPILYRVFGPWTADPATRFRYIGLVGLFPLSTLQWDEGYTTSYILPIATGDRRFILSQYATLHPLNQAGPYAPVIVFDPGSISSATWRR